MAVFHASPVSRISSDERHTCERNRSIIINRSSHPSGWRDEDAARNLLSLAQRPRITEFDGVTVPMFTLPCGVHGGFEVGRAPISAAEIRPAAALPFRRARRSSAAISKFFLN